MWRGPMISRRVIISTVVIAWAFALTLSARTPAFAKASAGQVASAKAAKAAAPAPPAPGNDDCLACHDDDSLTRANGTPITVHKAAFADSVHGPMNCVDCHADLAHAELPH